MGRSEYGFLISTKQHLIDIKNLIKNLIKKHNKIKTREPLYIVCFFRCNITGELWVCLANYGGRDNTINFLEKFLPKTTIDMKQALVDKKPFWWNQTQEQTIIKKRDIVDIILTNKLELVL